MPIRNLHLKNTVANTSFGELTFDENGVLKSPTTLEEEAIKSLTELFGFERLEIKVDKESDEAPKEQEAPKEEAENTIEEKKPVKKSAKK